ncbi:MAG TPA: NAD(P)-dependent oxidoreductase [Acidimicrobiales bacterium]|nr:NAD(P)-dependent oxidoreductase [Acidimicrobiales bacterium]
MQSVAKATVGGSLGWIGTGRMGGAMAARLLSAGFDLAVYNRTREKTAPLAADGAVVVDAVCDLGRRDVVFITVASSDDLLGVLQGDRGLLGGDSVPTVVVDCSTVSQEASATARALAEARGAAFLAAPVSGNPKVARAGRLTMAVSGPKDVFDATYPYLTTVAREAAYVGSGDVARLVKLCHNLLLGVVIQSLVEVTVLAEKGGVRRSDLLAFLNDSVMGSMFTGYKTPALVNLDFAPTFTTRLLHKDFDLGLDAARLLEAPMPVAALVRELLQGAIGEGIGDLDFAALLQLTARGAGLDLHSEEAAVSDGLSAPPRAVEAADGHGSGTADEGRGRAAMDQGRPERV